MKFVLVFFILFISIVINLPSSVISRLGFEADYLIAALMAMIVAGLVQHKQLFLIVLVALCSLLANMPKDMLAGWVLDPDYFFAVLVGLAITPIGAKVSGKF